MVRSCKACTGMLGFIGSKSSDLVGVVAKTVFVGPKSETLDSGHKGIKQLFKENFDEAQVDLDVAGDYLEVFAVGSVVNL